MILGSSVGPASAVLDTFGQSDKPYEVLLNILQASFATRKNVLLRTYSKYVLLTIIVWENSRSITSEKSEHPILLYNAIRSFSRS